jgi:Lrp/AsnC family transcriptional regulator, leucine-responsive regulatory protein
MQQLDEFDKVLLQLLQQNNRTSAEALGKQVNLSTSAVQRRLTRLRKEKIIEADISVVSPEAIGAGITCVVDVTLHLGGSTYIDQFKQRMLRSTEVSQCYYVTGSYDFVVILHVSDMKAYEHFSKVHFMDNTDVKQFYTHVVMDRVKIGFGCL